MMQGSFGVCTGESIYVVVRERSAQAWPVWKTVQVNTSAWPEKAQFFVEWRVSPSGELLKATMHSETRNFNIPVHCQYSEKELVPSSGVQNFQKGWLLLPFSSESKTQSCASALHSLL